MGADDVHGFLNAAAFGDDVLDDEDFFAGGDSESAAEGEFAFLFFDEDEAEAELAGDFLAEDQAAHSGGDDRDGTQRTDLARQLCAEFLDDGHLLEGERALEELAAVEAAAKDEMTFEERAGVAEDLEDFSLSH